MSTPLKIYQYQSVVYNNTTTGASPFTQSWSFDGGIPLTGASASATAVYNVPGKYTVSLTVTDIYSTTKTLIEPQLIEVYPSTLIAGISGPTPSIIKMDEGYQVADASIGNPFPAISWYWVLPYGMTASTQFVGVPGYGDWFTLTGTYLGLPGEIYNGPIFLTANNGYSSSSASTVIQVQKMGPSEILFLNALNISSTNITTGFQGSIPSSITPPNDPISTQDFGYPVDYWIIKLDFFLRGSSDNRNFYFHSTNEEGELSILNGLWDYQTFMDLISGFIVVDGTLYSQYSTVLVSTGMSSGLYIIKNESPVLFLADGGDFLKGLYANHNYSIPLINNLLSNPYKILHGGNLQFLNSSVIPPGITGMSYIYPTPGIGASGENPMVYSSDYLSRLGTLSSPLNIPVYTVYIEVILNGFPSPIGATAEMGPIGSTGNDPFTSGDFFVAQDNSNGFGFVHFLNSAINSSIPGGTGTVDFVAANFYNCGPPSSGFYDPTNYNGVALRILDNSLVQQVSIADNSYDIQTTYYVPGFEPSPPIAPFVADPNNSQGSYETCSGLAPVPLLGIFGPAPAVYNNLTVGGSIGYS
jgi:hypothetical protein